jgi:four helix bundle protein
LYISPGQPGKRGFEDLECYKLALDIMVNVHAFSKTLPSDEKYDLYVQIRRSSKSATDNIGEGYGRYHYLDSLDYYSIARGELNETLAWLIDARVLGYIDQPTFEPLYKLIRQAEQALNGFMNYVRRQRAGVQEYGDKKVREDSVIYQLSEPEDENSEG